MKRADCKRGVRVFDRWWPWRHGVIKGRSKTFVAILWDNGEQQAYDFPHLRFLEQANRACRERQQ
jgi:hypothetical protein